MFAPDALADKVISVADGDTLTVLRDRTPFKIRLANIDAPEKAQPFGTRSRLSLAELCYGKDASYTVQSLDRYKRAIAVVTCDGVEANRQQVARGMAWVYVRYNADRSLPVVEGQARQAGRGLWREDSAVAPWEFRRAKKSGRVGREGRNDQVSR
ncbi:MAG: thermonuclease family protein [Pseudomonadota bacterium]